jgi:4-hydroxybenzoate polyprenyltransferase
MNIKKFFIAYYRLSRIDVILKDYFWALTIVSIIAVGFNVKLIDIALATITSLFIQLYAFIVNDCEDAEDDTLDLKKALRNPISAQYITYSQGIKILQITAIVPLLISLLVLGIPSFLIVVSALLVGHLYSWKKVRFKSMPLLDVLSHSYALSMYQVILFMSLKGAQIDISTILIALGAAIFSMGGCFYNQVRDYEVDVKSNLNNTSIFLGSKTKGIYLTVFSYILSISIVAVCIISRLMSIR